MFELNIEFISQMTPILTINVIIDNSKHMQASQVDVVNEKLLSIEYDFAHNHVPIETSIPKVKRECQIETGWVGEINLIMTSCYYDTFSDAISNHCVDEAQPYSRKNYFILIKSAFTLHHSTISNILFETFNTPQC